MPPTLEPFLATLHHGAPEDAWDQFVARYRRVIFAVVRRYTTDPDDAMTLFAHVCEGLRARDFARLRKYPVDGSARASFSTWLVTVVRNLIVDWYRARDGRPRMRAPSNLSPLGKQAFDLVFIGGFSHREARELMAGPDGAIDEATFARALRDAHAAVMAVAPGSPLRPVATSTFAEQDADDEPPDAGAAEQIAAAMATLDEHTRLTITLFIAEDMAAEDVARVLGLANAKAVYNRVNRGLASIRKALERRGAQAPGGR